MLIDLAAAQIACGATERPDAQIAEGDSAMMVIRQCDPALRAYATTLLTKFQFETELIT